MLVSADRFLISGVGLGDGLGVGAEIERDHAQHRMASGIIELQVSVGELGRTLAGRNFAAEADGAFFELMPDALQCFFRGFAGLARGLGDDIPHL